MSESSKCYENIAIALINDYSNSEVIWFCFFKYLYKYSSNIRWSGVKPLISYDL